MMRNYIKCIFPLFLTFGSIVEMIAQVYPVQGTAALIPPYALQLSDYATSVNERFVVNTLLADVTKAELHVRFKISIVGQNVKLETRPEYIGSPIILQGGIPLRLTNVELAEYFDPNHLNFSGISKTDFLKTGFLPEGFYQFCFEVYEYNRGVKISNTISAPAWLILNDPPIINTPISGTKLKPLSPQNVILQWTPRHTGSPNAAFTTEYDVKVVEVWPASRNPNDAILTQPAIFETTTHSSTLVYGPDATQLEPGRVYAFRVQARAMAGAEHLDLFKNNGYSETVTFIYGDACDAPVNVVAEASTPTRISLQWDASPSQTGYIVRYRASSPSQKERGSGGEVWYSNSSLIPSVEISGLKSNTTYEYQVMSACGFFESSFGDIASISTPDLSQKGYSCGVPLENFNLDPSQLIPVLKVGDVIDAGDFDVTVSKITGGNGVFSGAGEVVVPFLNQVKGRVTFDNITVNNDKRMVKGYMNVTGGGIDIVPSGVLSMMDQLSQSLSAADSILALARQYYAPAPDPSTFVADQVIAIPAGIKTVQKDPLTGNIVVVDNNGQTQTIPPVKNVAITDGSGKGVIVNKEGGKTAVSGSQLTAVLKREYNLSLAFAKTPDTHYGLDEQKLEALKANYEKLNEAYYVSWKAVSSIPDAVVATYNGKENLSDKIKFELDGAPANVVANGNSFTINIAAATTQSPLSLVAKAANGDKEQILGKLNVIGYDAKPVNLKIVKVNNAKFNLDALTIKTQLDKIYSQAVVNWNVEVVSQALQVTSLADPFDDGSSGLLSNYTNDMKAVINTYGDLQPDTYYLFVIDKPASGSKLGYMPRAKKAGFIFVEPHGLNAEQLNDKREEPIINTIAHELGHGAFTLKHTFDEYSQMYKSTTDNLMDYNNGTSLWKYQWDRIHDPAVVLGLFEGDEAGASVTTDIAGMTTLVNNHSLKTDTIFVISNTFKLDTKRNVVNGGEAKFRLTIKPEGGGVDVLYPSDDWKTVQNNESWVLELSNVQEGRYTLSFKVAETVNIIDFYVRTATHDYACSVCGRNLKLTQMDLDNIFPNSTLIANNPNVLTHFNESLKKGGFNSCYRQAHFFSQVYEESGGMKAKIEGSNYPVKRMLEIYKGNSNTKDIFFKQTFWNNKTYLEYASVNLYETSPDTTITKYEGKDLQTFKWSTTSASDTLKIPTTFSQKKSSGFKKTNLNDTQKTSNGQSLFNLVYANINGNGNVSSGDGYKFRGRGAIQLTGRATYREVSNKCNSIYSTTYNWESNPEVLENDNKAVIYSVAAFFLWKFGDLKNLDTKDVTFVTKKVNGGTTGLSTRTAKFNEYLNGRLNNCKIKK